MQLPAVINYYIGERVVFQSGTNTEFFSGVLPVIPVTLGSGSKTSLCATLELVCR